MPILVLPALAGVIIALVALLIYVGSGYFGRFVSQLVPDWHIPSFGSLRDFVAGSIADAVNTLQNWLDAALTPAAKIIAYPFIAAGHLVDGTITVLNDLRNIATWIVRTWVPRELANTLAHARAYADAIQHRLGAIIGALEHSLRAEIAAARSYASAIVANLQHRLGAIIVALEQTLRAEIAAARAYAAGLVAQLTRYVDTQLAKLLATVNASIAAVDAFAHAAYRETVGRIETAIRELEADIATAAAEATAAAVHDVQTAIATGIGVVWPDVVAGVEGAIDGAADGFDWIKDELAKIDLSKVTDIAGLAALTGISTAVLTRYLRECGMPNCRNLSHLGRDLQALFGLVEGAALFTLVAEMVANPRGAASELHDVLAPVSDGVVSSARSLFRVA